ncbi:hypothetical protein ACLMJK_001370 [Lecanora helva]
MPRPLETMDMPSNLVKAKAEAKNERRQRESFRKRKKTIFKNAHAMSKRCKAEVYIIVLRKGRWFTFTSTEKLGWPPTPESMANVYPLPVALTSADFESAPQRISSSGAAISPSETPEGDIQEMPNEIVDDSDQPMDTSPHAMEMTKRTFLIPRAPKLPFEVKIHADKIARIPFHSTVCPPGTACHTRTAHIVQQASQAQYRADLEQQARQQVERIHSRISTQHADLMQQYRENNDRYNQLHKAWVQAESLRKDTQDQLQQEIRAREALESSYSQQRELSDRTSRHLDHLLEVTRTLAHQLYQQQIAESQLSTEQKLEAKKIDITAVFEEKALMQAECEHLQMKIRQLRGEQGVSSDDA